MVFDYSCGGYYNFPVHGSKPHPINTLQKKMDHIIPISKGGTSNPDNLQAACRNCNRKKSSKILF